MRGLMEKLFFDLKNIKLVSSEIDFIDSSQNPFGQLIPVPTAVPPKGKKYNSFRLIIIAFSASLSCSDHPDISCPKVRGTAS